MSTMNTNGLNQAICATIARRGNNEKLVMAYGEWMLPSRKTYYDRNPQELLSFNRVLMINHIAAQKKFRIRDLPAPALELVLEHRIESKAIAVFLRGLHGVVPTPIPLPAVTKAGDRELKNQAIRVTMMQTELHIHSGPGNEKLQTWLESLDFVGLSRNLTDGFDAVRALVFPFFSRFPHHIPGITSNNDINLMLKCRGLKKVPISFVRPEVEVMDPNGVIFGKLVDRLVREYYLDQMVALDNLETLQFIHYCSDEQNAGTRGVAGWFKAEFARRRAQGHQIKDIEIVLPDGTVV